MECDLYKNKRKIFLDKIYETYPTGAELESTIKTQWLLKCAFNNVDSIVAFFIYKWFCIRDSMTMAQYHVNNYIQYISCWGQNTISSGIRCIYIIYIDIQISVLMFSDFIFILILYMYLFLSVYMISLTTANYQQISLLIYCSVCIYINFVSRCQ